jgi:hypothetical protein
MKIFCEANLPIMNKYFLECPRMNEKAPGFNFLTKNQLRFIFTNRITSRGHLIKYLQHRKI